MPNPPAAAQHSFQAPTGTRDFYPAELARLRYIQDAWRRTSINHGFEEIDGPTFEHLDLYTVKSGEGIVSELFSFERFGGEKKFALRPEFTPTLARLYATKAASLPKPTKWFWQQNCFRAERPQRGRLREFCQWNCDIIGDDSYTADADIIACAVGMLESLGLTSQDVRIKVGSRDAIQLSMQRHEIDGQKGEQVFALLDERPKITPEAYRAKAEAMGLSAQFVREHDPIDRSVVPLDASASQIAELFRVSADEAQELLRQQFKPGTLSATLREQGLAPWCEFDSMIVRGLAYYTGMVFEVHEATGAERAIAGGGRYDKLIEMFGGPPTPAVGFGMGDVVLSLVLQDKGLFPTDDEIADKLGLRPDVFVISNGTPEADVKLAPMIAELRRAGLHARRSYKTTKNVGKLLGDATKARARHALIIENGESGQLKNLTTQEQRSVALGEVVGALKQFGRETR